MDFGQFRTVNVISQEEFQSITPSVSTPSQQVPPPPPISLQSGESGLLLLNSNVLWFGLHYTQNGEYILM